MKRLLPALLLATSLMAQDDPTIRVETRIVEVEVVVRGSNGPVENLTAEDFTVFDKGRRQRISGFALKRESNTPALRPMPLANRTYRQEQPVAPTVILLDTLNSRPQDLFELRRQIGLYLQRAAPHEPVAVYALTTELLTVQDFTQDRDLLNRRMASWSPTASNELAPDIQFMRDLFAGPGGEAEHEQAMLENVLREVSSITFIRRADITAYAFREIASHLAGIPGRKKLIWAGGGFPAQVYEQRNIMFGGGTDVRNYSRLLTPALEALNEAQIAVYPIGVANPALDPTSSSQLTPSALALSTRGSNPSSSTRDTGQRGSGIDTLNLVAAATGGKAFYALTDTAGAVEEAMQDSAVTYQITFTPSERDLDGKYHELKVEVRGKGLEVRHRKGYLAADRKPPTAEALRQQLRDALEAPLDVTAIGLAAQPIATAPGQPRQYVLRVDARDLQIDAGRKAAITLATSYPGSSLAGSSSDLDLTFTEARLKEVLANGYLGRVVIEHPNAKKARFTVQDRSTGRTGTLTVDLPAGTN